MVKMIYLFSCVPVMDRGGGGGSRGPHHRAPNDPPDYLDPTVLAPDDGINRLVYSIYISIYLSIYLSINDPPDYLDPTVLAPDDGINRLANIMLIILEKQGRKRP